MHTREAIHPSGHCTSFCGKKALMAREQLVPPELLSEQPAQPCMVVLSLKLSLLLQKKKKNLLLG